MPVLQPTPINIQTDEWKEARPHLMRALNYLIKDIYEWIANIQGLGSIPESSIAVADHDHKSAAAGGDYAMGDVTAAMIVMLTNYFDQAVKTTSSPTFAGATINSWVLTEPFPVGAIYLNVTGVDPNTELGYGTWTQVAQGQFLVGEV